MPSPRRAASPRRKGSSWGSRPGPMSGPPASWPSGCQRIASWSRCYAILASAISECRSEGSPPMSVNVYIPTPFRRVTNNEDRVSLDAPDVRGLLDGLEARFAGLRGLVRNEQGEVHHHVNIYVNSEAIESLAGLATSLEDGEEGSI